MATPHVMNSALFIRGMWPGDVSGNTSVINVDAGNNRMLIAFVTGSCTSITLDAVSMHRVGILPIFYLMDSELPATAGTYAYYITGVEADSANPFILLKDVNQISPITSSTSANNLSLNVTSLATNLVLDYVKAHDGYSGAGDITMAVGAGQTGLIQVSWSSNLGNMSEYCGVSYEVAIGNMTVMDWGAPSYGILIAHHAVSVGVHPIIFGPSVQNN